MTSFLLPSLARSVCFYAYVYSQGMCLVKGNISLDGLDRHILCICVFDAAARLDKSKLTHPDFHTDSVFFVHDSPAKPVIFSMTFPDQTSQGPETFMGLQFSSRSDGLAGPTITHKMQSRCPSQKKTLQWNAILTFPQLGSQALLP